MCQFTFFSQKSLPLLRPLNTLANKGIIGRNVLLQQILYHQISSETSGSKDNKSGVGVDNIGEQDPHSKIIEILRESTAMNNQSQAIESQVKYGKIFRYGELYAPHELNEDNYKNKRNMGRRKPPTVDTFNALKLNPLIEYKNYTLLSNFVSDMGKILPRSLTGLTAKNQRKLAKAIKRARSFGLISSTHRHKVNFYDIELTTSQMNKNFKNKKSEFFDFES